MVTANPSYDEMKKVVTEQEKRPLVLNRWTENSVSDLSHVPKFIWMGYVPQRVFGADNHPIILTIL